MITKISIAVLILFSCGTLYLLDYFLKQDQKADASQMHSFLQKTRDEANARAEAKVRFEAQTHADLTSCQNSATKTNADYLSLIQKALPSKRGPSAIPPNILDEAALLLQSASAECQKTYDAKLRDGS